MQARKNDPCKSILKLAISNIESKLDGKSLMTSNLYIIRHIREL